MKLPKIDISIDGVKYDHSFNTDVAIDQTCLDEEFCTQAEKYAFYSFLAAQAKSAFERRKFALEQIYAALDHKKRTAHEMLKVQDAKHKYVEKMIDNEVITDADYKKAKLAMLDARLLSEQLASAATAIAQRKDMLVQLGLGHRTVSAPTRALDSQQKTAHDLIRTNPNNKPQQENGAKPKNRRRPRSA